MTELCHRGPWEEIEATDNLIKQDIRPLSSNHRHPLDVMPAPVPQEELPILEAVINVRNRLYALKKDRGDFIKASDVNSIYKDVIKQVTKLNDVRDEESSQNNRVDTTLADVFSLLSLFYLTIGRNNEAPATYSQIASMRQILNHMNESAQYNQSDLAPFQKRLAALRQIVQRDLDQGKKPNPVTKLLLRQINDSENTVKSMQESLSVFSPELAPIHDRLIQIRRQLVALAAKDGKHKSELKPYLEELRKIDSKRVDGKFLGPGGSVPSAQALCSSTLEESFELIQQIQAEDDSKNVAESLKPIYDRLTTIRSELEALVLTHRWTLRETDLFNYTLSLQEVDKMRVEGKFLDAEGNKPKGQFVLLYLLRRCYGLIYKLLSASEPVSEELMPIANKLNTVKKCLNEVIKYGGPFNPRDLYPYQLALWQIDSMRKDGKFIGVDGNIPEGQGIVSAHLSECHELIEMLKEAMDDDEEEEDEEGEFDDEDEEFVVEGEYAEEDKERG